MNAECFTSSLLELFHSVQSDTSASNTHIWSWQNRARQICSWLCLHVCACMKSDLWAVLWHYSIPRKGYIAVNFQRWFRLIFPCDYYCCQSAGLPLPGRNIRARPAGRHPPAARQTREKLAFWSNSFNSRWDWNSFVKTHFVNKAALWKHTEGGADTASPTLKWSHRQQDGALVNISA